MYLIDVFFFKQKTAYEMRISDWSSDVCSSDLNILVALQQARFRDIFESDQQSAGLVAGGRDFACIQFENTPAQTGKLVLDLESTNRFAIGNDMLQKLSKRGNVPLPLIEIAQTAPYNLIAGHTEQFEKRDRKSTRLNSSH